jgi:hypothetical protein
METILKKISETVNKLNVISAERLDILAKISEKTATLEQETNVEKIELFAREKYDLLLSAAKMDDEVRNTFYTVLSNAFEGIEALKKNSQSLQSGIHQLQEVFYAYMLKIANDKTTH